MPLSGYEKAVIFLNIIGEETAAEVLKSLDIKEIGKLTIQMRQMKAIDKPKLDEVINEVSDVISKGDILIEE